MHSIFTPTVCISTFLWSFANGQSTWYAPIALSNDDEATLTFATLSITIPTNATVSTSTTYFDPASPTSWNSFTTMFTASPTYTGDAAPNSFSPTAAPSTPPAVQTSDCLQCSLYWQWASVYYWPTTTTSWNPSTSNATAVPTIPAEFYNFEYPSIYLIMSTIAAGNPCTQVGSTHNWVTMSFAPGELSTIVSAGGPTQAYDPATQPPAAPSALPSGGGGGQKPYVDIPVLAPPPGIFDIDPDWSDCVEGTLQGFDPPSAIPIVTGFSPPVKHQRVPARLMHRGKHRRVISHRNPPLPLYYVD